MDALYGVDLHGDVDMEMDGDNEETNEEEEDEEEEDEEEEVEDEEEDEVEDDGKETRTIGHCEMVHTLAPNVDTMAEGQPIVLPEQGPEMREHTQQPHPVAPSPCPQTLQPRPQSQPTVTHRHSKLECLGLVTPRNPRPVDPTLREAEAAGNSSDMDLDKQLLRESAGGDSLTDVPFPDITLRDFPHHEVLLDDSLSEL